MRNNPCDGLVGRSLFAVIKAARRKQPLKSLKIPASLGDAVSDDAVSGDAVSGDAVLDDAVLDAEWLLAYGVPQILRFT